jgi:excisionase family DNA binding protein
MPESRTMSADGPVGRTAEAGVSDQTSVSLAEPLLNAPQAAELLNVRLSWVRDAAREGVLPCVRVGRHLRFTKTMLEDWLLERFNDGSEPSGGDDVVFSSSVAGAGGGVSQSRRVFRPRTDAALLASLSEPPVRGR